MLKKKIQWHLYGKAGFIWDQPLFGTGTVAIGSCGQRETGLNAIPYGHVATESSVVGVNKYLTESS